MELLKAFTLVIGIGMLAGAVMVVSWDVFRESERHRLLTRLPRYSARHYSGQQGVTPPRT